MNVLLFKRDAFFYPLLFAAWGAFILIRYHSYSYYNAPLPSVSAQMNLTDAIGKQQTITKNIEELQKSLGEEKDVVERGHIEHNIGTAYYDNYKSLQRGDLLDSAQAYYEQSIRTLSTVARFYYNLGRIFTERREHLKAKANYEKALQLEPNHVLALHNLALLNFYELGNRDTAKALLEKALAVKGDLPICNYVLGEIALQQGRYEAALEHFRREVNSFSMFSGGRQSVPVSRSAMNFAASKSHLELAILYSTRFIDAKHAQANFHAYLRLEPDPQRRDAAIAEMKKYWVVKDQ